MEYDSKTKQFVANALLAQTITANGDTVGAIIDTKLFGSLTFAIIVHSHGGVGTHTLKLEDGDASNLSDAVVVASSDIPETLLGVITGLSGPGINRVGYIGKKRFVRATIVTTLAAALTGVAGVVAVQSNPLSAPTADQ